MTRSVFFNDAARAELREAAHWYESKSAGLGRRFKNAVLEVLRLVADQPRLFAIEYRNTRGVSVDGFPLYRVYYRLRRSYIEVVAVFHTARDPRAWQRRAR